MSGIAGICNLDGAPADPDSLRAMMQAIAHRGPDASGSWMDGPVALGHQMLQATPESRGEIQPFPYPEAGLCITLDGRVDNRAELRAALETRGYEARTGTDAELVLQAYACWGEDCPQKILGDFAFAIWDAKNRALFCARDQIGIKPFYYTVDKRRFIFGSELQQLFAGTGIACEPNEGMIGEYLANAITSRDETLYRGVFRLPPAYCLSVRAGRAAARRYWDADPARAIRYRTDAEYAEHFLDLFKQSVKCRLRSLQPAILDLSGGLDSSSIVGVIGMLERENAIPASGIEAFSLAFPGMPCDESNYIRDVVEKSGIRSTLLAPSMSTAANHADYVRSHRDFPGYPGNYMWESILTHARQGGARVRLTGLGGDDWLGGTGPRYLELLRQLKPGALWGRLKADSGPGGEGLVSAVWEEIRKDALHALPSALHHSLRRILRRTGVPHWIDPAFARKVHLAERLRRQRVSRGFGEPHRRDLHGWLHSGYLPHSFECDDRSAAMASMEFRHPFHDRRIVEMAFAMPRDQFWRNDQYKFVLREAMQGALPESVRQRTTKADFSHSVAEAFRDLGGEALFGTLPSTPMRWVDKGLIEEMCRQLLRRYAQGDESYADYIWPPWMAFGIDLWYRINFGDRLPAPE